jgi:16S rRNA processing protein RimM
VTEARILEVGRIGRAHGLRGEVAVTFLTDRPERTAPGASFTARTDRGAPRDLVVAQARRHQQRWLLRFDGIDDRDAAAALTGSVLYAPALPSSGDDELWVHDLVGATVLDTEGRELGTVTSVEANPAHDLLVLDAGPLVPVTFVTERDTDADGTRRIVVDVPEGLLDL